jgi:hypothetical protein
MAKNIYKELWKAFPKRPWGKGKGYRFISPDSLKEDKGETAIKKVVHEVRKNQVMVHRIEVNNLPTPRAAAVVDGKRITGDIVGVSFSVQPENLLEMTLTIKPDAKKSTKHPVKKKKKSK